MMTFVEKEQFCENLFEANGPFWHVYSDGTLQTDIFCSKEEFREGMIALAVCAVLFGKAQLVTFELMNNHVHFIMMGAREDCLEFFGYYKQRLLRTLKRMGRVVDLSGFSASILQIESLKDLRNEIVYANRNAYVANQNYTPFSYPWGGGWAYFSPVIDLLPVVSTQQIGYTKTRELTHYRDVSALDSLKFVGNVPFIPSFCRVDIGQGVFQNARSYFHLLSRNAEAYSQIAIRLKDTVFLTDDEMFVVAARCAEECYSNKLRMLTPDQRIGLARKLHYDYNASNSQLRRVLRLEMAVLNELFPKGGA